jgi:hypothetical protein
MGAEMKIAGYCVQKQVLIYHDLSSSITYIKNNVPYKELSGYEGLFDRTRNDCLYSKALFKENRNTCYGPKGAKKAVAKVQGSKLFGKFKVGAALVFGEIPSALSLDHEEYELVYYVRDVFRNRGQTNWSFSLKGGGALRLYPSNGAMHSLRPSLALKGTSLDYIPHLDRLIFLEKKDSSEVTYLEIIMELDRVLEKYSDAGAIAAIYIELGHLMSTLNSFLPKDIKKMTLSTYKAHNHNLAVRLARIEL